MSAYKSEFEGNICGVRAVEDAIRASGQYTERLDNKFRHHPIQGENFGSISFCKYYDVYPGVKISWNMPANVAIDWMFRDMPHVDVTFHYDYRMNKASVTIKGGPDALTRLSKEIPDFSDTLTRIKTGDKTTAVTTIPAMGDTCGNRSCPVPSPQPLVDKAGD